MWLDLTKLIIKHASMHIPSKVVLTFFAHLAYILTYIFVQIKEIVNKLQAPYEITVQLRW